MWRPTSRSNGELKRGAVVASSEVKIEDRMAQVSTAVVSVQVALRVMRAAGVLTGPEGARRDPTDRTTGTRAHRRVSAEEGETPLPFGEGDHVTTPRWLEEAHWQYTASPSKTHD